MVRGSPWTWLGLAGAFSAVATPAAQSPPGPRTVADIPEARYVRVHPSHRPLLKRTHDLFRLALHGEGTYSGGFAPPESVKLQPGLVYTPLPWRLDPEPARHARLLRLWATATAGDEMMLSLALSPGEGWCSPELEIGEGARLRLEAASVAQSGDGRLELRQRRPGGAETVLKSEIAPKAAVLSADAQWDVPLAAGRSAVCFSAVDHAVAVGKPRVLEPESAGADARPRWVVLTIVDALRADALTSPEAPRSCPTLLALAKAGAHFREAISPGCHTRAAVSSILTGRDVMRIDPLLRLYFQATGGSQAPADALYSRGNLMVGEFAEAAGYYSVFLGNNRFLSGSDAFTRASTQGRQDMGTVDTVALLPALLARHADERVLLVYYVSTPHGLSVAPQRLYDSFGCAKLEGIEAARCAYLARVRHADEAVAALLDGLRDHGIADKALHVVTADHGERFHDGEPKVVVSFGRFTGRTDETHGNGCGFAEVNVPLLVAGPGIAPSSRSAPVSSLDIVPTLLEVLGVPSVSRLDGEPLPLARAATAPPRTFVSHGFCNDSLIQGSRQLLRWRLECQRHDLEGRHLGYESEMWDGPRRLGTNHDAPGLLRPALAQLREWVISRVPGPALILDASRLAGLKLRVSALEGTISDYGPSATADTGGLGEVQLALDRRSVRLDFKGYRGLFFVATHPSDASVRVDLDGAGASVPLFIGPLQLPLAVEARPLDPRKDAALLVARDEPGQAPPGGLRLWWQPYRPPDEVGARQDLSEINRVLREWGYVR